MTTWIMKNLTMLILNMALNFMLAYNLEKLQGWQSKLSSSSWFHMLMKFFIIQPHQ
jgi:hypothetical protein